MTNANGFKIEKGFPMPTPHKRGVWPFGQMSVGDSFSFEAELHPKINSAASHYGKRTEKKFSVRKDGDGYRCWRIA